MPVAIGEFQRDTPKVLIELPLDDVGVGEFTACGHLYVLLYSGSFPVADLAAAVGAGVAAEAVQEASACSLRGSDRPAFSGTPLTTEHLFNSALRMEMDANSLSPFLICRNPEHIRPLRNQRFFGPLVLPKVECASF